jgi:uncharacterized protein (UPF0332 family)
MGLSEEEKRVLITHRLHKSKETMAELKEIIAKNCWYAAANRLYYACYYAVSALLMDRGFTARTHAGSISLFGQHFVKTGIVGDKENLLLQNLFELRQRGDYSDWITITEKDILPFVEPAEQFIQTIENLINV